MAAAADPGTTTTRRRRRPPRCSHVEVEEVVPHPRTGITAPTAIGTFATEAGRLSPPPLRPPGTLALRFCRREALRWVLEEVEVLTAGTTTTSRLTLAAAAAGAVTTGRVSLPDPRAVVAAADLPGGTDRVARSLADLAEPRTHPGVRRAPPGRLPLAPLRPAGSRSRVARVEEVEEG